MVNVDDLKDLVGRECIALESGRATVAKLLSIWEDRERVFAELETTHATLAEMNRIRLNGEPAIAGWRDISDRLGKRFTIVQSKENVFRGPSAYLQFSSPYGGTRLLFLANYVDKVRSQNGNGWEWDDMMQSARAGD